MNKAWISVAVAVAIGFGGAQFAAAQSSPVPTGGNMDIRPSFDSSSWTGSAIYSKATGEKLLCTMRNKDTSMQSITMSWDGKRLRMNVAQRSLSPVDTGIQLSYQGMVIPSSGGSVSYLRSVRGVEIGGENPIETLRGRRSIDVNIVGEAKAMTVQLPELDGALERLGACYGG